MQLFSSLCQRLAKEICLRMADRSGKPCFGRSYHQLILMMFDFLRLVLEIAHTRSTSALVGNDLIQGVDKFQIQLGSSKDTQKTTSAWGK